MTARHRLAIPLIAALVLSLSTAHAQWTPLTPGQPLPAVAPIPADRTAFLQANGIADPQKKIDALEKFLADFPTSGGATSAYQSIFDTLVKNWPDQKPRIVAAAQKVVDSAPAPAQTAGYSVIATRLLDAGVLLDVAEEFAAKGVALTDAETNRTVRQRRAVPLAALGRVYMKQGRLGEAEKTLKDAYDADPAAMGAAAALAELTQKKGDTAAAVGYWSSTALSGRMTVTQREQFEAAYRSTHRGQLTGLEEMLDAKYVADFPMPLKSEPYRARAERTDRTALFEVFTGSGCPPCAATDLATDLVLERYGRSDVVVLMHHVHIPLPDPMTSPASEARARYYGATAAPTTVIDGVRSNPGGGNREATKIYYDRVVADLDRRLEVAASATVAVDAVLTGSTVKVKATAGNLPADAPALKMQIALAESDLRFSGENGIRFHPMVVRGLAGSDLNGLSIDRANLTAEWNFDLIALSDTLQKSLDEYEKRPRATPYTFLDKKSALDPAQLSVVVYLQEEQSKKVLQSKYVKVKP